MEVKKTISPESVIELQKLDCNCNDCVFMVRDMETYKKWENFHREVQQNEFDRKVARLNKQADEYYKKQEFVKGLALEKELRGMKFVFDKSYVSFNYGNCTKLNKSVSFMPNTIQLETQQCFKHRRDQ
jgi:hypothetical protein